MSAAAQTKLFGIRIPVDPKIFFGGLAVMITLLFWYNSRGDEEPSAPATANVRTTDAATPALAVPLRTRTLSSRRAVAMSDRGVLRLRPIDPTKGDIDPTLRLDLLARLQGVQPVTGGRSLFESGGQPATGVTVVPVHPPILPPGPRLNGGMPGSLGGLGGTLVTNIPLKYYGFLKPTQILPDPQPASTLGNTLGNSSGNSSGNPPVNNRGFFLDGDNVLVASEGEVLKQRYLVVELTPNSARLEDTQLRQGQTLPVVAAAMP